MALGLILKQALDLSSHGRSSEVTLYQLFEYKFVQAQIGQ